VRFVPLADRHWAWIRERTNPELMANTKGIAAEDDKGKILGVCVCDTWTYNSVQLHIAIDNPIVLKNGRLQKEVFDYIFNHSGRGIALGLVPAGNEKAIRFDKKLGFVEIFRIKDGYEEGQDMVVLEMRKEDCRWIKQPEKLKIVGGSNG